MADRKITDALKKTAAAWQSMGAGSTLATMKKDSEAKAQQVKKDIKEKKKAIKNSTASVASSKDRVATRIDQLKAAEESGDVRKILAAQEDLNKSKEQLAASMAADFSAHENLFRAEQLNRPFLAYQQEILELEKSDKSPTAMRAAKVKYARKLMHADDINPDQREELLAILGLQTTAKVVGQAKVTHTASYTASSTEFHKSMDSFEQKEKVDTKPYTDPYAIPAKDLH